MFRIFHSLKSTDNKGGFEANQNRPQIILKYLLTNEKKQYIISSVAAHGGVAQLGERHTGSVEVIGSIPTVSTI